MPNLAELSRYLRYRLSKLSAENAHHRFEELVRHFARLQLCTNILPATGPVGAGGDQGLDFESYRSYIKDSPLEGVCHLGRSGEARLAFAASLSKKIVPKIKEDITAICSGPLHFETVYYFCETDVPIAKRHSLQAWAKDKYQIGLEIFDGQAISECLTNPSLFWIAEEYLGVPADGYPKPTLASDRYMLAKKRWLESDSRVFNYADMSELTYGIRSATHVPELRPDLPTWIKKLSSLENTFDDKTFKRRAAYEICVAALRGQNNLDSQIKTLRAYFADISMANDSTELEDISNLLLYSSTATKLEQLHISRQEVEDWISEAIEKTEKLLKDKKTHEEHAVLLEIRGRLSLCASTIQEGEMDVLEMFDWWTQALEAAEKAPLFPLERFADMLTIFAPEYGRESWFVALAEKADKLLTKRTGGRVAAAKCRDRAMAMYKAGDFVSAISLFHQAKIKWFTAETLSGSLLCMEMLADCYRKLGLLYASKFCLVGVLAAGGMRDKEKHMVILSRASCNLANVAFENGEWSLFVHLAGIALDVNDAFVSSEDEEGQDDSVIQHLMSMCGIVKRLSPEQFGALRGFLTTSIGMVSDSAKAIEEAGDRLIAINELDDETLWQELEKQFWKRPFSDSGDKIEVCWTALGLAWRVECNNAYDVVVIVDTLCGIIQMALVELSQHDLILLPIEVVIVVEETAQEVWSVSRQASNDKSAWRISIPSELSKRKAFKQLVVSIAMNAMIDIISECSLLPDEDLLGIVNNAFADNLVFNAFVSGELAVPYAFLCNRESFENGGWKVMRALSPERGFAVKECPGLAWNDTDGPGYSKSRAEEYLRNRYRQALEVVRLTLPRFMRDERFREVLCKLRSEGLLDWELLVIVASVVVGEKVRMSLGPGASPEAFARRELELMYRPESEEDPEVDVLCVDFERCAFQHKVNQFAVAKTWGLELRQATPPFRALRHLLDTRYHQREDDVEHDWKLECG